MYVYIYIYIYINNNNIIIVTSFAPISSKIKLSGATKPGDRLINLIIESNA